MVKQLSIFIENSKGRLAHVTRVLGEADVDLQHLSIADTTNFGILRAIVTDYDKALQALRANGYTVNVTSLIAIAVPDRPGGLADALHALEEADVGVEYLYSFVRKPTQSALILLKVDDTVKATVCLEAAGMKLLHQDELV